MPKPTKDADRKRARAMRNLGYSDGYTGRPARFSDTDYQASWRRGKEARQGKHE